MRRFVIKCLCMCCFLSAFTGLLLIASTDEELSPYVCAVTGSREYASGYNMGADEIISYIHKVRQPDTSSKLIIGDSVAFRLFSELQDSNPHYCIAGSNRGITMSGQYILLHEYLKHHPDATDVYLVLIENSLITTYETDYGYQYAVMPFLMTNTTKLLDAETIEQMKHTYGSFMVRKKAAKFIHKSAFGKKMYLNLLNKIAPVSSTCEIPDVSERYLIKMAELCKEENVTFHLIAGPLMDSEDRQVIDSQIRDAYENSAVYAYFPDYFDQIQYYPEEYFSDGIHPIGERAVLNQIIRKMQADSDSMYDLNLE